MMTSPTAILMYCVCENVDWTQLMEEEMEWAPTGVACAIVPSCC